MHFKYYKLILTAFRYCLLAALFTPLLWIGAGGEAFAQQCNIIYVTPTGASSGSAGTQTTPASLPYAFTLANATNNQLWLAVGTYSISNELPMISGIIVEGGFDPNNNWKKTNSQQTVIVRDASNMDAGPNRIVAVECTGISNFSIHDITIITSDAASGTATSTYGIHLSNSSAYILSRLTITSGNATDGVGGVPGIAGINGANGQVGQPGDEDGGCCTGGGTGGSGSYSGSNAGGNGGTGGARGTYSFPLGGTAPDGSPGQNGQGTGGGIGGVEGLGYCVDFALSFGCDQSPSMIGFDGADGADGTDGADGANGIPVFATYFVPGDGQNGAQGDHGGGGGGGGGGGSQGCIAHGFFVPNNNGSGPGGSGGGEGGQGGFGATAGTGGGGSFGIYIDANGAGTFLKDCFSNSGLQGIGGLGGTPGGNGGGSSGGAAGVIGCDIGTGGAGGAGGSGGKGGNGGNGAPGVSLPLYEDPAGGAIAQSDMKATVEPAIYLQNTGCTFHDINYTTNATGIIQWFFDGGSTPLSGTGDSVKTQYTYQGRHSITLVVDGVPYMFTDFTGIFSDGTPYLPTINGPDTVCPGSDGTFSATFDTSSSVIVGYDWKIYNPGSTVPDQTGNVAAFTYTFPDTNATDYAGTYMVTLQTESQCCGWSKMDTFYVEVVPYLTADVFVSATAATICDGETATFFAVPVNGGNNPTFLWNVNGTSAGVITNSFSSSTFNNGDDITCTMTSSYPCPLNSPVTSLPFSITVYPLPTASCGTTGAYLGANTGFSATPANGTAPYSYNWDFGDGGVDTAASPTHLYGGTGTFTYSVSVTDANGCSGVCTNTVDIIIAPYVFSGFTNSQTVICGSTTVQFTDTSKGNPTIWLWDFGDGFTSIAQNPSHSYLNPGNYSVSLTVSNGVFTDTYLAANIVSVKIVPAANISYITDTVCFPLGAQFFDISSGAAGWVWDFGDGSSTSSLQNPSHTYINPGNYIVTLTVTSIDNCTASATATVYVLPAPTASFTQTDTVVCSGETITFTDQSTSSGSSLASWNWNFGNGATDNSISPVAQQYDNAGSYNVYLQVTNGLGCVDDTIIYNRIEVKPQPDALFDPDTTEILFPDNDIALTNLSTTSNGNPVTSWLWDFGNGTLDSTNFNATAVYEDSGIYTIWLYTTVDNRCRDSMSVEIKVIDIEAIYFANSFSPNADGINDVFYVYGNNLTEFKMYIFNRWGDAIFESSDMSLIAEGKYGGWDGKLRGTKVPDGIYPFRVDYKLKSTKNKLHSKIGSVMILGKK